MASVYFFPFFGAILSDVFLGKYRTIICLSLVYCLGHLALALDETRIGLYVGLTLIAVLCLFVFGGEVLRSFAFALVVGVLIGTYSSVFVASPILLWWQSLEAARGGRRGRRR